MLVHAPRALLHTPCTLGISSLFYGSLSPHQMAAFGLNAKQFHEVSLQIYFILFLLELPSEVSFSFSSQCHHICCTICGLWVPSCFFMQPIYCTLQFSPGIKRSNFVHKILDPSLDSNGLFPFQSCTSWYHRKWHFSVWCCTPQAAVPTLDGDSVFPQAAELLFPLALSALD